MRYLWMDRLRGVAVLLIIIMHAVTIPALHGATIVPAAELVSNFLQPYRIPALLLLSGMLLPKSVAKPMGQYYWGKLANIAWPYLVWCLIYLVAAPETDGTSIWFWLGGSYLWYLVVILACYLIGPAIKVVSPLLIALGCIVVMLIADPSTNAFIRVLVNAPYFFVGAALMPVMPRILRAPGWLVAVASLGAVAWGVYSALLMGGVPRFHLAGGIMSVIGVLCLAWALNRIPSVTWLEWVGRHSLEFYVAHFPAMLAAWHLGAKLLPDLAAYAILLTAGVAVSALLARYLTRSPLFRLPTRRATQKPHPTTAPSR